MKYPLVHYLDQIESVETLPVRGRLSKVVGLTLEGFVPNCVIGDLCALSSRSGRILAEVVGFREKTVLFMPFSDMTGIGPDTSIMNLGGAAKVPVGEAFLGRIIDGMGNPLDGGGPLLTEFEYPLYGPPPSHLGRRRITEPLDLGIRSINALLTVGCGQRVGIFAGSGVGKSVLLGMMARFTSADVNIIALIGERGREVKEFIERDLKEEGLRKSVVIVATSDQPPLVRRRGAFLAMTLAEYFRDQHRHVLFMMDSLTRLAHAQREIGLAIGEPPTTKGYTPSVFALLPKLLERAGTSPHAGSITGLFSVLVDGDDLNDPVPDTARAILDGHIVLSREIAHTGQYPAVDVLMSISRVMVDIVPKEQIEQARRFVELMASYKKAEDLIQIGAYKPGSVPKVDEAISKWEALQSVLKQDMDTPVSFDASVEALRAVVTGGGRQ